MKYILSLFIVFFTSSSFAYIPDHSIAKKKIGPWEGVTSTLASGAFATTSTSQVDVTNLSVSLKTYGRPVRLELFNNNVMSVGATGSVAITGSSGSTDTGTIYFLINTVEASTNGITAGLGTSEVAVPCSAISTIIHPIAGTHAFKIQAKTTSVSNFKISNCALMAYEL